MFPASFTHPNHPLLVPGGFVAQAIVASAVLAIPYANSHMASLGSIDSSVSVDVSCPALRYRQWVAPRPVTFKKYPIGMFVSSVTSIMPEFAVKHAVK
jgi:hypothetical protein